MPKLQKPGKNTSPKETEILNISTFGVWMLVDGVEYFLPFKEFPWFRDATVKDIHDVKRSKLGHLHWPALDVDLDVHSLGNLEKYPLVYKK